MAEIIRNLYIIISLMFGKDENTVIILQVISIETFWEYINETYMPFTISGIKRYLLDATNFLATTAQIRQQRVVPSSCTFMCYYCAYCTEVM